MHPFALSAAASPASRSRTSWSRSATRSCFSRQAATRPSAFSPIQQAGHPHPGTCEPRPRALGGTSLSWGGQLLPFPDDSDWPISSADLAPFTAEAEQLLGVDSLSYAADEFFTQLHQSAPALLNQLPATRHLALEVHTLLASQPGAHTRRETPRAEQSSHHPSRAGHRTPSRPQPRPHRSSPRPHSFGPDVPHRSRPDYRRRRHDRDRPSAPRLADRQPARSGRPQLSRPPHHHRRHTARARAHATSLRSTPLDSPWHSAQPQTRRITRTL